MPEILYKSKNFIVINKPSGVPSQSDPTKDADAMTITASALRNNNEKDELFLVHRLDRVVGGLMVFARNRKAAAEVSGLLMTDKFTKCYIAVVEGKAPDGTLTDHIYKDARAGKAFVKERPTGGAKYAELYCEPLAESGSHTLVSVKLKTGRFHQIRVQLSSRGVPIVGDGKYGSRDHRSHTPALFASRLSFECLGERIDIKAIPDKDAYPWCEFDLEVIR